MEQELYPHVISENHVVLPQWLDDMIFKELGANYCPQNSDMTNIDDNKQKTLNYLGTYFPRSYAEAYCIFCKYFSENNPAFLQKEDLSIFDFGCGTGGEIIGLLTVIEKFCPRLKKVKLVAFDGNQEALRIYRKIQNVFQKYSSLIVEIDIALIPIDDSFDLNILRSLVSNDYDIFVTFKAINEFVTKQPFEKINPYKVIAETFIPKISQYGILFIEDITSKNQVSNEWLPIMMDSGLKDITHKIIQNEGYNQSYFVSHSRKQNDSSKVAWRLITI